MTLYLYRVDSLDGKVYGYFEHPNLPSSEYVVADLMGEVGDTLITFDPTFPASPSYLIINSVDTFYKWGLTKLRKNFIQSSYPSFSRFSYTEDIGMDFRVWTLIGYSMYFERTLKGCIINGLLYGDTTLTDVGYEENPITNEFELEQNYPNPFNPITNIRFRIVDFGFITLKVYDILGNEVATLVNEEPSAGEYEVEFDGTGIPSGIYFYQLKSGNFVQTKKMLLLK